jgi:hypothetical protein
MPGVKCDESGTPVPPGAPPCRPRLQPLSSNNPYYPFHSRVALEAVELLYKRSQLPLTHVNSLMELWAASLFEHGAEAPFSSAQEMLQLIDAIQADVVPWNSFETTMDISEDAPSFEKDVYTTYMRDPHALIKEMLGQTQFDGHLDDCAYLEYNKDGKRVYQEYMSANHAWS